MARVYWDGAHEPEDAPQLVCIVDQDGFHIGEEDAVHRNLDGDVPDDSDTCACEACQMDDVDAWANDEDEVQGMLDGGTDDDPCLVEAPSQQHLWQILNALAAEFRERCHRPMQRRRLVCHMRCGRVVIFRAYDDIPRLSRLCECGLEWVVRYQPPLPG